MWRAEKLKEFRTHSIMDTFGFAGLVLAAIVVAGFGIVSIVKSRKRKGAALLLLSFGMIGWLFYALAEEQSRVVTDSEGTFIRER